MSEHDYLAEAKVDHTDSADPDNRHLLEYAKVEALIAIAEELRKIRQNLELYVGAH